MKCKMCKKEADKIVCQSCQEFLEWTYPGEKVEDILQKYKELSTAHFHLRKRSKP